MVNFGIKEIYSHIYSDTLSPPSLGAHRRVVMACT